MLARVLVIGSFVVAAIVIYAIVDVAATPTTRVRGLSKPLWFVAIVVFPLIGAILWFILGRPRRAPRGAGGPPVDIVDRGKPGGSGYSADAESVDERIARLEEELRRLEDEENGDSGTPPKGSA